MSGKNRNDKNSFPKEAIRILPTVIRACPIYLFVICLNGLMLGIFLALNIVALDGLFHTVEEYVKGTVSLLPVVWALLFVLLCVAANPVLNGINTVLSFDFERKVSGKLGKVFHDKCGEMLPADFEDASFLEDVKKAKEGVENSVLLLSGIINALFVYVPYFVVVGIYLYRLKPALLAVIGFLAVPNLLSQMQKGRLYAKLEDRTAPIKRKYEHYEECMISREYFKETRLLGAFGYFLRLYGDTLAALNLETVRTQKKSVRIELVFRLLSLAGYLLTLFLLVKYLLDGSVSIANFGAVLASLDLIMVMLKELICNVIGRMMKKMGTVANLVKFLDRGESRGRDIQMEEAPEIRLDHISFAYPGCREKAIADLSLTVRSGETVAVVGQNGAGKSTLVKLLSGLYLPDTGRVLIDGQDTKTADRGSLMGKISGVFQKFQRYAMPLNENVAISDMSCEPKETRIAASLEKADLTLSREVFPQGGKTMLSREFDGVDLSGGYWQRVAIARGFYKRHHMILLDEPTAAIDPMEETKLYRKFTEMSRGKTSILVTHRLGSTKIADRIVVMEKGRIVQVGTHENLMRMNGKYREMFEAQSKWYTDKDHLV